MPEFSDYIESRTQANPLDGTELVGGSQSGAPRKWAISDELIYLESAGLLQNIQSVLDEGSIANLGADLDIGGAGLYDIILGSFGDELVNFDVLALTDVEITADAGIGNSSGINITDLLLILFSTELRFSIQGGGVSTWDASVFSILQNIDVPSADIGLHTITDEFVEIAVDGAVPEIFLTASGESSIDILENNINVFSEALIWDDGTSAAYRITANTVSGIKLETYNPSGLDIELDPDGDLILNGNIVINDGVSGDGSGLKHARITTGSIGAGSTALVTITWGTAFADANYTVSASVEDSTASSLSLSVVHVETISSTQVQIRILNNAVGSLTGILHVIAIHD